MSRFSHSPPPPPRREEDRDRFSRTNFAPLPNRHEELGITAGRSSGDSYIPPPPPARDDRRGREPLPVRERDAALGPPGPGPGVGGPVGREFRDERDLRDERPRRPPPHWEEEDRPKRRRSPSPSFSSHRPRRHSPDSHSYGGNNGLPDPASLPNQLTFKQFAEWFRANHPSTAKADEEEYRRYKLGIDDGTMGDAVKEGKERVGMGKRYERYRKEYTSRQLFALYLMHRSSPWFIERYSHTPEAEAERKRINHQGRIPTVNQYIQDLKAGKFDSISFDQSDESSKRPSGSASRRFSEHEEPEGLDRMLGETGHSDESGRLEVPPQANQVFVKSVPPTISRKELEALFASSKGFLYLAITEPSVKKAFHRVAWAQFAEDSDVAEVVKRLDESKIDNFKFHMAVNTAATIGRIRYAPATSNSLGRLLKDGEKAKALALQLEAELVDPTPEAEGEGKKDGAEVEGEDEEKSGGLKELGSSVVEEALEKVLGEMGLKGDDGELSGDQKITKAKTILDHWISYLRNGLSTCYYCVAPMSFPEELQRKCVAHVRSPALPSMKAELDPVIEDDKKPESTETEGENGSMDVDEKAKTEEGVEKDENALEGRDSGVEVEQQRSKRLEADIEGDKERIRGGVRGGGGSRFNPDERWEESLDSKLAIVFGEADLVELGGRDLDEETKKLTAPMIKQEETSKYRCKECNKLFKAPEFVMKHIVVKHGEGVQAKLDDITTFNNFIMDPQHLQPTQQVPAAIDDQLPQLSVPPINNLSAAFNPDLLPSTGNQQQQQQQMMMMMMQMQQAMMMQMSSGPGNGGVQGGMGGMGNEGRGLVARMGGYAGGGGGGGGRGNGGGHIAREPLPPPPPGAEDPRARKGRVSYMDLDEMGSGGDGGLPY